MPARDLRVLIAGDESQLNRSLERAEARMGKYTASVTAASDKQAAAYRKAGESSAYAAGAAGKYASAQEMAARRVAASTSAMLAHHGAAMQQMGDRTITAGRKVSSAGSSILAMVAPIDLAGAAAGKLAVDFNRAMEMLHTQANYSQKDVERLSKSVLELAPKVGSSPKELAEGLYHVASAGFDASKAMEIVKEAMMGARLGLASADETTYALVSVMRAAPKDIKSAADAMGLMNSVVGQGDMRMQQLVDALSTGVIPRAKAAGLGFRDVGAALDIMTARGIPAQMSGTRLSQTFAFMEKQSSTAKKALEEIGIKQGQLGEDLQKPNGLLVAVEDLSHHLKASGKDAAEQNKVILESFGGGRSSGAIQTLLENVGELRKRYQTLPEASKAVEHLNNVWKDFKRTPAQQLAQDQQQVNKALIELGNRILPAVLPIIKDVAHDVGDVAKAFQGLSGGQQKVIVDLALAGTALGLIAKPIGGLITTVGFFQKSFGAAEGAVGKFVGVFGTRVEETVPLAERAGMAAGVAYGNAFSTAAAERTGIGGPAFARAGAAKSLGYDVAGYGATRVPGFGPRAGVPGLGPPGYSVAEQMGIPVVAAETGGFRLGSAVKGVAGNLGKAGMVGLGGFLAAELAHAVIPGRGGDAVAGIGKDTAFGAAIGTAIAPGIGTAIGGGLGAIAGALKEFTGSHPAEDRRNRLFRGKGQPNLSGSRFAGEAEDEFKKEERELEHLRGSRHTEANRKGGTTSGPGPTGAERQRARDVQNYYQEQAAGKLGQAESQYVLKGTRNPGIESIVRTSKADLEKLKPAGREAFMGFIKSMVETLEKNGHLPKKSLEKVIGELKPLLKGLPLEGARSTKDFTNAFLAGLRTKDMLGAVSGVAKKINDNWDREFGLLPVTTHMTLEQASHNANHDLGVLQHIMKTGTQKQREEAEAEYKLLAPALHKYQEAAGKQVKTDLTNLAHHTGPLSAKGTAEILKQYESLPPSLRKKVEEAGGSVAAGIKKMNALVNSELRSLGAPELAQLSNQVGFPVSSQLGGPTGLHTGTHATGGYLGQPGERGRDSVIVKAGRGEAILNHSQQPYTEMGLAVTKAMGMQPYGSLHELFAGERTPHHMAAGGFAGMVSEANSITGHRYPYLWGGGHDGNFTGPYDCSGAVSAVLHAGGVLSAPRVAGGFENFGMPGAGKVTLFVNDNTHVYMRMGGRYFGTSMSNPGGGAAWFAGGPRPGFTERHVPDSMVAGGALIASPKWTGPGGAMGVMGKRMLHDVAHAANQRVEGIAYSGQVGGGNPGDAGIAHHAGGGFVATSYGPPWGGIQGGGITSSGIDLSKAPHKYLVATDPKVIPTGSQLKIWPNPFGYTGTFTAADTGGAIKGNRIDFYDWRGRRAQDSWGRRGVTVTVVGTVTGGRTKKPSGLVLSGHQESTARGLTAAAGADRSEQTRFATYAGETAGELETHMARWSATPPNLATAEGAQAATQRAFQVVKSDKDVLRFYREELKALQKEAKQWAKLRDFYRHLARKVHGTAKKQALDKAATYSAKIGTARNDAKTLKGTIYAQETKLIEGESAEQALPGEIAKASQEAHEKTVGDDASAYSAANEKVDLEVRAGMKSEAEGKAAKKANAERALAGGYGELDEHTILQIRGDLREFGEATQEATAALEAHTQALTDSAKALNDFLHASERISAVENATLVKAIADLISGQIGGKDYHGRANTPGAGSAARY